MKHFVLATLLFVGFASGYSQQPISSSRGEQKSCAILTFDKELREAIASGDVARIALLVDYPLRVNDDGGGFYIDDARSLSGHFDNVFTPTVRKAILTQEVDAQYCGAYKLIYGLGEAVVNLYGRGYRVGSINISTTNALPKNLVGRVEFACRTDVSRMVIDNQRNGGLRLRVWKIGTLLAQKPDKEITGGKKKIEGTSPCTHAVWSFQSDGVEFELSEIGCYPDSNQPPAGALGQFAKSSGQKDESWSWCY